MGAVREDIDRDDVTGAPRSATAIAAALREAREYTLALYAHLSEDQQAFPCLPTINPPRWEVGHVGWFQEFWCRRYAADDAAATRTPSRLRDADAWFDSRHVEHDTRWSLPLPDWSGIFAYLARTLEDTLEALERSADGDRYFFELALYHEDMHGEALLMTLQTLGLPLPPRMAVPVARASGSGDIAFRSARVRIGSERDEPTRRFVFDNEKYAHDAHVGAFAIARRGVTQGEFAAFVDDGGYRRSALWTVEGQRWLAIADRDAPAYWRRAADNGWQIRRFDRWEALDPLQPVLHVNAFEAEAFCRWAGRRLPTETEWETAAVAGALAMPGPAWEWTSSAFRPYPGFAPDPYEEYSRPWFGDHRVLRGGAWCTRPRLVHARFRNFYRPERHDAFAGLRTCAAE